MPFAGILPASINPLSFQAKILSEEKEYPDVHESAKIRGDILVLGVRESDCMGFQKGS